MQVSPFEAEFVESADPLATSVSFDTLEIAEPALLIEFENVPADRLDEIQAQTQPNCIYTVFSPTILGDDCNTGDE